VRSHNKILTFQLNEEGVSFIFAKKFKKQNLIISDPKTKSRHLKTTFKKQNLISPIFRKIYKEGGVSFIFTKKFRK